LLQLLRLFRLVRLARLIRTLEGLDVLYIMTTAIKGMSQILVWAVCLLSVMLMTCALALTQVLQASYFNEAAVIGYTPGELEMQRELYQYFGSFTRCFLSMWEMTLANWPKVTRLLSEEVSEWFMLLCVMHKITIGFAVIGVINGVILLETFKVAATDDMIMVRQKKRASEMMKSKMTALFEALDQEGDGTISRSEFVVIGDIPEVKTWLASMDIETDDLSTLFNLIDDDGSGGITTEELVARVPRIKGAARCMDMLAVMQKLDRLGEAVGVPLSFLGHDSHDESLRPLSRTSSKGSRKSSKGSTDKPTETTGENPPPASSA